MKSFLTTQKKLSHINHLCSLIRLRKLLTVENFHACSYQEMTEFSIDNRKIGEKYSPCVTAEMSTNHNGDINNAYKIIDMAKACGADAVKLQTYTPNTLTIDSNLPGFQITDGLWAGQSLFELHKSACTPY